MNCTYDALYVNAHQLYTESLMFSHCSLFSQFWSRVYIPTAVFQSLVVALVLSRLDYCNSVLAGLPANLIRRLQSVQNAAARLKRAFPVSGTNFWISLPSHVPSTPSLVIFRQHLKTFLIHLSYPDLIF